MPASFLSGYLAKHHHVSLLLLSLSSIFALTSSQICPGIQQRDPTTGICECPSQAPDGSFFPLCLAPLAQDPLTCDCVVGTTTITATTTTTTTTTAAPNPTMTNLLTCGDPPLIGNFIGQQLNIDVLTTYDGDLTFYVHGNTFSVQQIAVFDATNNAWLSTVAATNFIQLNSLARNTRLTFSIDVIGQHGVFWALTTCKSASPTLSPTPSPTTTAPSVSPTRTPTSNPLMLDIAADIPLVQCSTSPLAISGFFNAHQITFVVQLAYAGDMDIYINGLVSLASIDAYNALAPTTILASTNANNVNHLTLSQVTAGSLIVFQATAIQASGQFFVYAHCASAPPTVRTTPLPTMAPTPHMATCPGPQFYEVLTETCLCPPIAPDGTLLPQSCTLPMIRDPFTCTCIMLQASPTRPPSFSPSNAPTFSPTAAPVAPAIVCNDVPKTGPFANQPVTVEIFAPSAGGMMFYFNGDGFVINIIKAYDSADPMTVIAQTAFGGSANFIQVPRVEAYSFTTFIVEGEGFGTYNVLTTCTTMGPSLAPTLTPTWQTGAPTSSPTSAPTDAPTVSPTHFPSVSPTPMPSRQPTTMVPTQTGDLRCGDSKTAFFKERQISFVFRIPYDGEMSFDVSQSLGFTIVSLFAVPRDYPGTVLAQSTGANPTSLVLPNLVANTDVIFTLHGTGTGIYVIDSSCASKSPTNVPTRVPTPRPSMPPTLRPTVPSRAPSRSPTPTPTNNPTATPITPFPTRFGHFVCGDGDNGFLTDVRGEFTVRITMDGDLSIDFTESVGFTRLQIDAVNKLNPTVVLATSSNYRLTVERLPINTDVIFKIEADQPGIYSFTTACLLSAPTKLPTQDPILTPTLHPAMATLTTLPSCPGITYRSVSTGQCVCPQTAPNGAFVPQCFAPYFADLASGSCSCILVSSVTPAPTQPSPSLCGVGKSGDFSGDQLIFEVRIPYDGHMTFFVNGFVVTSIKAYRKYYEHLLIAQTTPGLVESNLAINNLAANTEIVFQVDGTGTGTFHSNSYCQNAVISNVPSTPIVVHPTPPPTLPPVPTVAPTSAPAMICGGNPLTVSYTGQPVAVTVRIPTAGHMTVAVEPMTAGLTVQSITAYLATAAHVVLDASDPTDPGILSVFNLNLNTEVIFVFTCQGSGTLMVHTACMNIPSVTVPVPPPTTPVVTPPPPQTTLPLPAVEMCGSATTVAAASAQPITILFRIASHGDMTFVVNHDANAAVSVITAFHVLSMQPLAASLPSSPNSLTINGLLPNTDVMFKVETTGTGYVYISTSCSTSAVHNVTPPPSTSAAPPTWPIIIINVPAPAPIAVPVIPAPVPLPTPPPIYVPVLVPTKPGVLACGAAKSLQFTNLPVTVEVFAPTGGDMTVSVSVDTEVIVFLLTAYNAVNPDMVIGVSSAADPATLVLPKINAANTIIVSVEAFGIGAMTINTLCTGCTPDPDCRLPYFVQDSVTCQCIASGAVPVAAAAKVATNQHSLVLGDCPEKPLCEMSYVKNPLTCECDILAQAQAVEPATPDTTTTTTSILTSTSTSNVGLTDEYLCGSMVEFAFTDGISFMLKIVSQSDVDVAFTANEPVAYNVTATDRNVQSNKLSLLHEAVGTNTHVYTLTNVAANTDILFRVDGQASTESTQIFVQTVCNEIGQTSTTTTTTTTTTAPVISTTTAVTTTEQRSTCDAEQHSNADILFVVDNSCGLHDIECIVRQTELAEYVAVIESQNARVGYIEFSGVAAARVVIPLSSPHRSLLTDIMSADCGTGVLEMVSNITVALELALTHFASMQTTGREQKIVLLTNGVGVPSDLCSYALPTHIDLIVVDIPCGHPEQQRGNSWIVNDLQCLIDPVHSERLISFGESTSTAWTQYRSQFVHAICPLANIEVEDEETQVTGPVIVAVFDDEPDGTTSEECGVLGAQCSSVTARHNRCCSGDLHEAVHCKYSEWDADGNKLGVCCVKETRNGCTITEHCCELNSQCFEGYCLTPPDDGKQHSIQISVDGQTASWIEVEETWLTVEGAAKIIAAFVVFCMGSCTIYVCIRRAENRKKNCGQDTQIEVVMDHDQSVQSMLEKTGLTESDEFQPSDEYADDEDQGNKPAELL